MSFPKFEITTMEPMKQWFNGEFVDCQVAYVDMSLEDHIDYYSYHDAPYSIQFGVGLDELKQLRDKLDTTIKWMELGKSARTDKEAHHG